MPIIEPAKVATSPNATRSVSWISPCGSISTPVKRSASPPMESVGFSVAAWVHATHQKTSAPTRVSRPQHAQQRFCLSTCYPAECGSEKDQDGQDFLKSGAKVQQKNEATKFCGSVR